MANREKQGSVLGGRFDMDAEEVSTMAGNGLQKRTQASHQCGGLAPDWVSPCGAVTLYNQSCWDVAPHLSGIDCIVTSPPYNQLGERMPDNPSGIWKDMGRGFLDSVNTRGYADDIPEPEYQLQQNGLFTILAEVVKASGSLFYNHQCRWRDGELLHPVAWFKPHGWTLRQDIVWDRCGGMMFNARMFCRFDERVLWFVRGQHKWNQEQVGHGTVWRIARETNKPHPVAFPIELPERCILAATDEGDVVLDPYGGSMTTGVACVRLGRRFIGIERERRYFDLAVSRITAELGRCPLFDEAKPVQRGMFEE